MEPGSLQPVPVNPEYVRLPAGGGGGINQKTCIGSVRIFLYGSLSDAG